MKTLLFAAIALSNLGALILQINHLWRGLNPDYSGLLMAVVVMIGLNAGYSGVALGLYSSKHPLRFVLLILLIPFMLISARVSVPASADVFVADTYKRITDEKLGPDAIVYNNKVARVNNQQVAMSARGDFDGAALHDGALDEALAAKKRFMESGGTHESQTEKALLGKEYGTLQGEARAELLDERVRAKGFKWAWTLEAIDKCLTVMNAILVMLFASAAVNIQLKK